MIIFVGSTRAAKIDGTRDALTAIARIEAGFAGAEVRPVDLGRAGPRMPMTESAIIAGAEARARALVDRVGEVDSHENGSGVFFVGLEGGLDPIALAGGRGGFALKSWACVTDARRWGYGSGGSVIVPDDLVAEVQRGRELGDVIDALAGTPVRGTRGAWGVLTCDLVTRRDSFRVAVISAFAPFLSPALYGAD